ncbi:MAG: class I SAM-dependent methyltransferase [Erythrobacter sp.]|uniref:SAM-dependent methyltransferase n=1 Tax=Erythrobacter sp. TaxID=1042 RepID=UPI003266278F
MKVVGFTTMIVDRLYNLFETIGDLVGSACNPAGLGFTKGAPSLDTPVSQACTQAQMESEIYADWCAHFNEKPWLHRKQWEFVYILQSLHLGGMMEPGKRGLGFGVGGEPLPALFAEKGMSILGTDLDPEHAQGLGWIETDQHAASKNAMNNRGICSPEKFERLVDFRSMDMNALDPEISGQFDFCWSACALEHLGSIEKGLKFIENSIDTLRPGGLAVHTTEFNCSSNASTLDNTSTVLFRRRDFERLGRRLARQGHTLTFNFDTGDQPADQHIDVPPYTQNPHLKLQIAEWVTTSYGITVRKAG